MDNYSTYTVNFKSFEFVGANFHGLWVICLFLGMYGGNFVDLSVFSFCKITNSFKKHYVEDVNWWARPDYTHEYHEK